MFWGGRTCFLNYFRGLVFGAMDLEGSFFERGILFVGMLFLGFVVGRRFATRFFCYFLMTLFGGFLIDFS